MSTMTAIQAYHDFNSKLKDSLPMNNSIFTTKLVEQQLLSGDLVVKVNSKQTPQEAAENFLNTEIEPFLGDDDNRLQKLLLVMEEFSPPLKHLASEIKQKMHSKVFADKILREQSVIISG